MDIHKPKPWHSFREFLKEYAIIVVGVLTALAAEQGVEALHWAQKVERGKAHEATELTALYRLSSERVWIEQCLDRRLVVLGDALLAGDGAWTPPTPMQSRALGAVAYFAPTRPWGDETWKTLVADGTVNHLSDADSLGYSRIYGQVSGVRISNDEEAAATEGLGLLQVPSVLTHAERNQLATEIGRLRMMNHSLALRGRQLMLQIAPVVSIDRAKMAADYEANSRAHQACTAMGFDSPAQLVVPSAASAGMSGSDPDRAGPPRRKGG